MSAQIVLTPTTVQEGVCFQSAQDIVNGVASHMTGELPGNFGSFNQGSDLPSVNDRDKPWIRSNPDGSPDGTYNFWNGAWRRKHPVFPGLIMFWQGSVVDIDTWEGGSSGAVTVESGPFWRVFTGLACKFPLGAGTLPSGLVRVSGDTGGEEKHVLVTNELPSVLGSLKNPFDKLIARKTSGGTASLAATGNVSQDDFSDVVKGGDDLGHNTMPPYLVGTWVQRTGRIWILV